ncbi:MAG: ABC transporter permease [Firmicutes bacterium]|nr:ABC transporter permease [Bacillota bacterium]
MSGIWLEILTGTFATLYITLFSTAFAYIIGLPLGVVLTITDKGGLKPILPLNKILGFTVNALRSVPFIILVVMVIPLTRFIVGTSIGTTAMIVPLVVAAAPFVARIVENSLKETDRGVIEAAKAMGASNFGIVVKVMLPEARSSLLLGLTLAAATIMGYSAMAGIIGGGGLGAVAINYGYYRYETTVLYICVSILIVILQILQEIGLKVAKKINKS